MRSSTISVLFSSLSLLAFANSGCVIRIGPYQRTEIDFQEKAANEGVQLIDIQTQNGSIEIIGDSEAKEIDIRGKKFASGNGLSEKEALEYAEQVKIEIQKETQTGTLRVKANTPRPPSGVSLGAQFTITLPPTVVLQLKSSNGKLKISHTRAEVTATTSNGAIQLEDIEGEVEASTSNGKIEATSVRGDLHVETSNGAIQLQQIKAQEIYAATTNGSIKAIEVSGNLEIETSNGSIELRAVSVPTKPKIRVSSTNGSVRVELPSNVQGELSMSTSTGRANADLQNASVTNLSTKRNAVSATLNGGGGSIEISTSNGSVELKTN